MNDKSIRQLVIFFKVNSSLDLFYRVGLGTIDNRRLKEFATTYNNTFLNFFKKRLRSSTPKVPKESDEFVSRYDKLVFEKEREELPYKLSLAVIPLQEIKYLAL